MHEGDEALNAPTPTESSGREPERRTSRLASRVWLWVDVMMLLFLAASMPFVHAVFRTSHETLNLWPFPKLTSVVLSIPGLFFPLLLGLIVLGLIVKEDLLPDKRTTGRINCCIFVGAVFSLFLYVAIAFFLPFIL